MNKPPLDKTTVLSVVRDIGGLGVKTAGLALYTTGKLIGGAHTIIDSINNNTRAGYFASRKPKQDSLSNDDS